MGTLIYGKGNRPFAFDDRQLAHLQLVIGAKLRRGEGFFLSWIDEAAKGGGHTSLWLSRETPLYFRYRSSVRHHINHAWIEQLTLSANSARGLQVVDEPDAAAGATPPG